MLEPAPVQIAGTLLQRATGRPVRGATLPSGKVLTRVRLSSPPPSVLNVIRYSKRSLVRTMRLSGPVSNPVPATGSQPGVPS